MIPITNQSPPRTYSIFHNSICFFRGEHKTNTTFGTAPKHCPLGVASNAKLCLFFLTLYVVCVTLMNEVLQIFRADRCGLHAPQADTLQASAETSPAGRRSSASPIGSCIVTSTRQCFRIMCSCVLLHAKKERGTALAKVIIPLPLPCLQRFRIKKLLLFHRILPVLRRADAQQYA